MYHLIQLEFGGVHIMDCLIRGTSILLKTVTFTSVMLIHVYPDAHVLCKCPSIAEKREALRDDSRTQIYIPALSVAASLVGCCLFTILNIGGMKAGVH